MVTLGLGEGALFVRLSVGWAADLGFQSLCGQVGAAPRQGGLLLDDLLGRVGLRQRPGLRGARLGLLGFGQETGLLDHQVALVLGLHRRGLLLLLGR